MSLNNQEKFVNSFWVIILLVAVGIYFWVIPKNSIAEAYSKKKHYNLKKTSRFLAVGFWIIAISCVPVLISLWFDTDRKSTRLNSSHRSQARMPSSA